MKNPRCQALLKKKLSQEPDAETASSMVWRTDNPILQAHFYIADWLLFPVRLITLVRSAIFFEWASGGC